MNLIQDVIIQMYGDGDWKQQLHEESHRINKATHLVASVLEIDNDFTASLLSTHCRVRQTWCSPVIRIWVITAGCLIKLEWAIWKKI